MRKLPKSLIVAFVGKAGSGKTTAAKILASTLAEAGIDTWIISFSAPIKEVAARFGWAYDKDERGRKLLTDIGSAARAFDPESVIKIADREYRKALAEFIGHDRPLVIIIDDLRMVEEAAWVRKNGGIVVRVFRPPALMPDIGDGKNDVTETSVDRVKEDRVLFNGKPVEELGNEVGTVLKLVCGKLGEMNDR